MGARTQKLWITFINVTYKTADRGLKRSFKGGEGPQHEDSPPDRCLRSSSIPAPAPLDEAGSVAAACCFIHSVFTVTVVIQQAQQHERQ